MNSTVLNDSNIKPLVSVCMITYNHQDYIKQAIESVLMQIIDFDIELIICNDYSTDNTNQHVNHIIDNNPKGHLISYFEQKENIGMMSNFTFALKQCKAKYIAICEGDDYWTDPLKLQKQVDFLESKPDIIVCFTQAEVLTDQGLIPHQISPEFIENEFAYSQLLQYNNFITTASVVFRRPNNFNIPQWFLKVPYGDMGLYKLLSNSDSFYGLKATTSVYRVHDKGVYSGMNLINSRKIYYSFYKRIYTHLNKVEKVISKRKMRLLRKEIATLRFPKHVIFQKLYFIYLSVKALD
ncbi:MAG: glycosyltransferase involved in cell wall biosynthesis [Flavobacteriaceae bacterium]|jgi:glycosyltransferase involved in cell wall biosynthesis